MADEKETKTIYVRSTKDDRKVLLHERDPRHPGGEIFLVNNRKVYEVFETKRVKQLIGEESLERVNWNSREAGDNKPAPPPSPSGRRPGRTVPELRPATDAEERLAKPPLAGNVEKQTARVPKTGE